MNNCNKGNHDLIEIFGASSLNPIDETVVRWCKNCGGVVVDQDFDGRTNPGEFRKMQLPNNDETLLRAYDLGWVDCIVGDDVRSSDQSSEEILKRIKDMETLIISGFPGIGKTYFKENSYKKNVSDSDSSKFSWIEEGVRHPDFPQNYIDHIKENIGKTDIILVSSHKIVRDALRDNEILFTLVYPKRELKQEYLERFKSRGNNESFVKMLDENWDKFIDEMENQKGCATILLSK